MMDKTHAEALRIAEDYLKRLGWKFTPQDVAREAKVIINELGVGGTNER